MRVLFQVHGMLHIVLPQIPIFPVYLPGRPGSKHLFSLTTWDIPAVVNRAIGFLKREAFFASNELLSVLAVRNISPKNLHQKILPDITCSA